MAEVSFKPCSYSKPLSIVALSVEINMWTALGVNSLSDSNITGR